MDPIKTRATKSRRFRSTPCVEGLEDRHLLTAAPAGVGVRIQEVTIGNTTELLIKGTPGADVLTINDNGTANAGNISVVLANGSTYTSRTAISFVNVMTGRGNDQVTYNLTGDLITPRTVAVDLGAGDDQFTANVNGAINIAGTYDLEVYGDAGNDTLTVNQTGPVVAGTFFPYLEGDAGNDTITYNGTGNISAAGTVAPGMPGGAGNDTITANYTGQIDGQYMYNLTMDGGPGNDVLSDSVNVLAGSTGHIGTSSSVPAVVQGGGGNDQIRYAVNVDPSATQFQVFAVAAGTSGTDTLQRTSNVQGSIMRGTNTVVS
jgi:hypothetical protein